MDEQKNCVGPIDIKASDINIGLQDFTIEETCADISLVNCEDAKALITYGGDVLLDNTYSAADAAEEFCPDIDGLFTDVNCELCFKFLDLVIKPGYVKYDLVMYEICDSGLGFRLQGPKTTIAEGELGTDCVDVDNPFECVDMENQCGFCSSDGKRGRCMPLCEQELDCPAGGSAGFVTSPEELRQLRGDKKDDKGGPIVVIAIVAVVLLVVALIFFLVNRKRSRNTSSSSSIQLQSDDAWDDDAEEVPETRVPPIKPNFCNQCGCPLTADAGFCEQCGEKVQSAYDEGETDDLEGNSLRIQGTSGTAI